MVNDVIGELRNMIVGASNPVCVIQAHPASYLLFRPSCAAKLQRISPYRPLRFQHRVLGFRCGADHSHQLLMKYSSSLFQKPSHMSINTTIDDNKTIRMIVAKVLQTILTARSSRCQRYRRHRCRHKGKPDSSSSHAAGDGRRPHEFVTN
jgi:hypothetical protein